MGLCWHSLRRGWGGGFGRAGLEGGDGVGERGYRRGLVVACSAEPADLLVCESDESSRFCCILAPSP